MKYLIGLEVFTLVVLCLLTLLTVRSWLFLLIQFVSVQLFIPGLLVAALSPWSVTDGKGHWPRFLWLFDDDEDGIFGAGPQTRARAIYWAGIRNYANNLRYVPGVSAKGRPYWRRTWGAKPGGFYAHAGWNSSGYPVLSAGRNVNPY